MTISDWAVKHWAITLTLPSLDRYMVGTYMTFAFSHFADRISADNALVELATDFQFKFLPFLEYNGVDVI